jgi:hypothetical protein
MTRASHLSVFLARFDEPRVPREFAAMPTRPDRRGIASPVSGGVSLTSSLGQMKKTKPAASPDAYVAALVGWRRKCVEELRTSVRASAVLEEVVKWGHLVYLANGPVLLIRAEDNRVLLGFWRGQRLRTIEPRLKRGGKYEMATLELREGMTVASATVRRLTQEAVALNVRLGDPTAAAKRE